MTVARRKPDADVKSAIRSFVSHDPLTLAASISFYTALSFAPVIVVSIWTISQLSPGAESALIDQLGVVFGDQVRDTAASVMRNATESPLHMHLSGLVSLVALIVSATTAFAQLQASINKVWGTAGVPSSAVWKWIRRRLLSFGMLAVIGFLLVITLVVSSALSLVLTRDTGPWIAFNQLVTLVLLSIGFGMLFRLVPDARLPYRYTFAGGLLTALLFELGKWILGSYLAESTRADAYGAASSFVLLLIWVYYSSLAVLVGAAATRYLADLKGHEAVSADS